MYLGVAFVRGTMPFAEHVMFAAGILTPVLGAWLIRATGDISLGLVVTMAIGIAWLLSVVVLPVLLYKGKRER